MHWNWFSWIILVNRISCDIIHNPSIFCSAGPTRGHKEPGVGLRGFIIIRAQYMCLYWRRTLDYPEKKHGGEHANTVEEGIAATMEAMLTANKSLCPPWYNYNLIITNQTCTDVSDHILINSSVSQQQLLNSASTREQCRALSRVACL